MKRNAEFSWNVWLWNFNHDGLEAYDVGFRFLNEYKSLKPKDRPKTHEEIDEWLDHKARYMFWSKCEYEMIIHGWPAQKNDEKVDIYSQLKLNWNDFVNKFIAAVS